MHVTLYGVVLFLHITVALLAFMMAGVGHAALQAVSRATTVAEARPWSRAMHRIEPLFPIAALVLLGLGAWLVHLGHGTEGFSFSDGWVLTAIVALVGMEALGGAVIAPRGKKLNTMVLAAADGPVGDDIHAAATDPLFWNVVHATTFGFIGVVFCMAVKPSGAGAVIAVAVGVAVGLALSAWQLRSLPVGASTVPGQRVPSASQPAGAERT